MLLGFITDLLNPGYLFSNPLVLVGTGFQIWMLIHAIQRREWMWVVFMLLFPLLNAVLYFFMVYRQDPMSVRGFQLPGAHDRRRISELKGQIHHLDKAHLHLQLGDIYFSQGKLGEAETCFRAALARDGEDLDIQSHMGQCLLRQEKTEEALPYLHKVCSANPRHEYGYTLMALAEAFAKVGRKADAIKVWQKVLANHQYDRARVQLAELHAEAGEKAQALELVRKVIADSDHVTLFEKKRGKVWLKRARMLERKLG